MSEKVIPAPAATVVLIRDGATGLEALLLRRNAALKFAGGSWVFPGGRIDPQDYDKTAPDNVALAARNASVREAQEETGLLINATDLLYFSHWTTPPIMPKRFATWFFIARVDVDAPEVEVDGDEIHAHKWFAPPAALEAQRAKEIALMPPTFVTLHELGACANVDAALQLFSQHEPRQFEPRFVDVPGGMVALYEGDAGYESNDPHQVGARHRFWMKDDGWYYEQDL
ncbi:MAG: NUDIX hydrolase [Pseudomonadales bacterium]